MSENEDKLFPIKHQVMRLKNSANKYLVSTFSLSIKTRIRSDEDIAKFKGIHVDKIMTAIKDAKHVRK